jgi:hypothetical protein
MSEQLSDIAREGWDAAENGLGPDTSSYRAGLKHEEWLSGWRARRDTMRTVDAKTMEDPALLSNDPSGYVVLDGPTTFGDIPTTFGDIVEEVLEVKRNMTAVTKETNPKDAIGIAKVPASVVPRTVVAEVGLAMMEGSLKYGRHNYRVAGVRASVYFDAVNRHMDDFWEGVDVDPDSGLSHVTKAIASLVVLRDSMIQGNWVDDRPPSSPEGWQQSCNDIAAALLKKYPEEVRVPAYLASDA